MTYQKKNAKILVDANSLTEDNGWDLEEWCGGKFSAFSGVYFFDLKTKNGNSRAELGDFIVKDASGEFSIWPQDEFNASFELFVQKV